MGDVVSPKAFWNPSAYILPIWAKIFHQAYVLGILYKPADYGSLELFFFFNVDASSTPIPIFSRRVTSLPFSFFGARSKNACDHFGEKAKERCILCNPLSTTEAYSRLLKHMAIRISGFPVCRFCIRW